MGTERKITYCKAINEAMTQEMERDSNVFVYGIGVGDWKEIFGTTEGLLEQFGEDRAMDTPLAEDTMTGFGIGAAISGMRPIHIHIRVDFMLLAFNQIANILSSLYYASRGSLQVPIVIRAIIGRGWGQGFQHSKSMFSTFAHLPGIKIIMPVTPYDAKGMMVSAIRDNNPVICFEHRWLYWQEGDVPEGLYEVPFGEAQVLREGKDLTIIAISWSNVEACQAADILLKKHGVKVEVVDPRTLVPLDKKKLSSSVAKTGKCLIVDNDWVNYGASAEIAAIISHECFSYLKQPVKRMGFANIPCPTSRHLENRFYANNAENIIRKVERMLKLNPADLSGENFYAHERRFSGPF